MTKNIPIDIYSEKRFEIAMTTEPNINEFSIQRSVLVVRLKEPFRDWVKSIKPKVKQKEFLKADAYLIPELDTEKQMEKWLRKYFDNIFRDQVDRWQEEGYLWIKQKRTFKMFKQWFDFSFHPMVYETIKPL